MTEGVNRPIGEGAQKLPAVVVSAETVAVGVTDAGRTAIDVAVVAWLDAKYRRTGSERTRGAYARAIGDFRAQLARYGADLASEPRVVAAVAQVWAAGRHGMPRTRRGGSLGGAHASLNVSPNTFNQRLAILSSFYAFARKRGMLAVGNPIEIVDRRPVQAYAAARPLDFAEVERRMAAIDRGEWAGVRDYALLLIGLETGRRSAELARLVWGRVAIEGGRVTLTLPAKGGKLMHDTLSPAATSALVRWLRLLYGEPPAWGALPADAPIWVALDAAAGRREMADGQRPLTHQALSDICLKRLGTSKVHALRHTFAVAMEQVGAKVSEIQARLGHSSIATTGIYLASLKSADNPYGARLEALYGVTEQPDLAKIQRRRRRYTTPKEM